MWGTGTMFCAPKCWVLHYRVVNLGEPGKFCIVQLVARLRTELALDFAHFHLHSVLPSYTLKETMYVGSAGFNEGQNGLVCGCDFPEVFNLFTP